LILNPIMKGHTEGWTAYALQERWEESDAAYVEAIRLGPAPAVTHVYLGQWYLERGMIDEARPNTSLPQI
jgi:tetratricopeptide (TPR) repeat protein